MITEEEAKIDETPQVSAAMKVLQAQPADRQVEDDAVATTPQIGPDGWYVDVENNPASAEEESQVSHFPYQILC